MVMRLLSFLSWWHAPGSAWLSLAGDLRHREDQPVDDSPKRLPALPTASPPVLSSNLQLFLGQRFSQ
jgi:hypothetical protein